MQLQQRLPYLKIQTDVVYFQSEDNCKRKLAKKEKVKQSNRFKQELKMIFLFNFLRLSEVVETLGKNGGASSHTRQLQEKI